MEQEVVEISIFYFERERLLDKLDSFRKGISKISPVDLSWDYFFTSKNEKHKVEEVLEYESGLKFLILENDIIWYETIPSFKDGKLFSLRSVRERSDLYEKLFNIERGFDSFSELYKILDRNDKLKKLGI
jgi:hypothetical protein